MYPLIIIYDLYKLLYLKSRPKSRKILKIYKKTHTVLYLLKNLLVSKFFTVVYQNLCSSLLLVVVMKL